MRPGVVGGEKCAWTAIKGAGMHLCVHVCVWGMKELCCV